MRTGRLNAGWRFLLILCWTVTSACYRSVEVSVGDEGGKATKPPQRNGGHALFGQAFRNPAIRNQVAPLQQPQAPPGVANLFRGLHAQQPLPYSPLGQAQQLLRQPSPADRPALSPLERIQAAHAGGGFGNLMPPLQHGGPSPVTSPLLGGGLPIDQWKMLPVFNPGTAPFLPEMGPPAPQGERGLPLSSYLMGADAVTTAADKGGAAVQKDLHGSATAQLAEIGKQRRAYSDMRPTERGPQKAKLDQAHDCLTTTNRLTSAAKVTKKAGAKLNPFVAAASAAKAGSEQYNSSKAKT